MQQSLQDMLFLLSTSATASEWTNRLEATSVERLYWELAAVISSTRRRNRTNSADTLPAGGLGWLSYVLSLETVRDEIQLTPDKNPHKTGRNSFCLGSFPTTRSRRYDDDKDSLSEIPFFRH